MKLLAAALSVAAAAAAAAPTLIDVYHRAQTDSANVSYFCFRIPVLARAASGALIAFAEGRHLNCDDAGDVRIVRRISHDDGATWSPIDQVKAEAGHTIGNPCPIVDLVTGTVHLIYSRDNREIFVTRSTDGGLTWGASANLTAALAFTLDPTNAFAASGPPGGLQLPSGRLIGAMYYVGLNGSRSAALLSDDHGATWRRGADVPVSQQPLPNASSVVYFSGESQVAPYPDGGPMAVAILLRVRGDFVASARGRQVWRAASAGRTSPAAVDHNHALAISLDGGESWGAARLLPLTSSYCEGSVAWDGTRLLLSAPSTTNGGRANLTLWSARRDASGRLTPAFAQTIYGGAAAYSSLLAGREEGRLLSLFERDNDPYVPHNLTLATLELAATRVPQR